MLILAAIAGAIVVVLALGGTITTLPRLVVAALFVMIVPGDALTQALFPGDTFEIPERLLLSTGLSLMIAALGGFALNQTAAGLTTGGWLIFLGGVALVAGLIAWLRRNQGSIPENQAQGTEPPRRWDLGLSRRQGVLLGMAGLVITGSLIMARAGALAQTTPVTQLWMLPAQTGPQAAVRLGIRNLEATPVTYMLNVEAGSTVLKAWPSIELQPGETWEATYTLPTDS